MKNIFNELFVEVNPLSMKEKAGDLIVAIAMLIIGFAILITLIFLFTSIVAIAKEKEDVEERMAKIKHSVIVGVCLAVEIVIIVLLVVLL